MERDLNFRVECSNRSCGFGMFCYPKVSMLELMKTLKGKLAIKLYKTYPELKQKPYWQNHFWSGCYIVTTVVDATMYQMASLP
jgi:REP element-mobilizing transposase RayT